MTSHAEETNDTPPDLVAAAEGLYRDIAWELTMILRELRARNAEKAADAGRIVRDVRAAIQIVFEERKRVDRLREQEGGVLHDHALDLAKARDEIGRRLACLRERGGG